MKTFLYIVLAFFGLVFTQGNVTYAQNTLPTPVAYWKLDEGSGIVATNSITSGSSGTLVNGPTWVSGKLGKALSFDGIDDQVKVLDASLSNLTTMTLSAWVNTRGGGGAGTGNGRIIGKGDKRRFQLVIGADNSSLGFFAGYTGGTGTWKSPTGSLPLNSWHHVVASYTHGDPHNTPRIYIDGVSQSLTRTNTPSGDPVADDSMLYIGSRGDNAKVFDGNIDQVRVYNQILSASEVNALYTVENPPNIVVIMTDDQDDMGSLSSMPKTRSLIGNQGLTFANSFVDFSLCCPSRVSFLTGQASHNTGVLANGGTDGGYAKFQPTQGNSLPVWLQQAGYTTAHMGKYPNGFTSSYPIPPGWTLWNGIADDQGGYTYYNYSINNNGVLEPHGTTATDYKTDVQAQKAAGFIAGQQNSAQPFFLWLAPFTPHASSPEYPVGTSTPPIPAPRHVGAFNSLVLPQPLNFNEADVSDKPGFVKLFPLLDSAGIANVTDSFRRRRESLLAVDDMVEKVVNSLQATGKLNNTVIVFTSDNGYFEGQHRRPGDKMLAYEESIRVPLLIRGPGISIGQTRTQLVNNLDLVATIEELADLMPGRVPDGKSLTPLFQNPSASWRTSLLVQGMDKIVNDTHLYGRFQAVRTNNYIYIEHNGTDFGFEKEFYDLSKDPYELVSKPDDPAYASIVADLQGKLSTLRTCAGSTCWMTSAEPTPPTSSCPPGTTSIILPTFPPQIKCVTGTIPPPYSSTPVAPGGTAGGFNPNPPRSTFTTFLRVGMNNQDVTKLQTFLSRDTSLYPEGLVTGYFGPLTEQAAIRFQEKYANEILKPLGLNHGTGIVGSATLRKLNELVK